MRVLPLENLYGLAHIKKVSDMIACLYLLSIYIVIECDNSAKSNAIFETEAQTKQIIIWIDIMRQESKSPQQIAWKISP